MSCLTVNMTRTEDMTAECTQKWLTTLLLHLQGRVSPLAEHGVPGLGSEGQWCILAFPLLR